MIALFGGTFDPPHLGHLNMAMRCVDELSLAELKFLPCASPNQIAPVRWSKQGLVENDYWASLKRKKIISKDFSIPGI